MPSTAQLSADSCSGDFRIFSQIHIALLPGRNLNSGINIYAFTAIHRHNHKFDRPLEEDEVAWISKTARVVEARYGSQKEMRGQQYRNKMFCALRLLLAFVNHKKVV